jgi:hypothetical protein
MATERAHQRVATLVSWLRMAIAVVARRWRATLEIPGDYIAVPTSSLAEAYRRWLDALLHSSCVNWSFVVA